MAVFGITFHWLRWSMLPAAGFLIGWKLDRYETERMVFYRDRSALYGRDPPPAVPSWP